MNDEPRNHPEGLRIALERIERESVEKTGILNLGGLGLVELPAELFQLQHLRCLALGDSDFDTSDEEHYRRVDECEPNRILRCWDRLASLPQLEKLSFRGVPCDDLTPFTDLTSLQSLDCSGTKVSDLSPLSGLTMLQSLDCTGTQVSDISPLARLTRLQSLECSATLVSDLSPLAGLTRLHSLNCSATQVSDLSPLAGLKSLQSLYCNSTRVHDLAPLAGFESLQKLNCSGTLVTDLSPLSGLKSLQSLSCHTTLVSDLWPLSGLKSLQKLNCLETQVSNLSPLAGLTMLQSFACNRTQVNDLTPLSGLKSLQLLYCSGTQVSDLSLLVGLTSLQWLDCRETQVSDLSPLSGLTSLQSLHCSGTQVSDLSPISRLTSLQSLGCHATKVSDLRFAPANLREIRADNLTLDAESLEVVPRPALQEFYAHETTIPGIPQEVLSKDSYDNCLPRLLSHLADLQQGTAQTHDMKLIVIGNGRVGKTQVSRRLRGLEPETDPDSTHGIVICTFDLASEQAAERVARIHLWDFGGQDIYHGTHALFMRTNALFLLVWTSASESSPEHEYRGLTFRNHRVPYWLKHIGRLAGFEQPIVIVQNQCDTPRDEAILALPDETLTQFRFVQQRPYSAHNNRGRPGLDEAIREAIADHIQRRGKVIIGRGRAAVIAELDELRRQDELTPPTQRRFRTLAMEAFHELCEKVGGISSVDHFLEYLHDSGLVFYRNGMFNDQIILDQAWALQAIYTVLDRRGPYTALRQLHGRFTRSLLALAPWKEYSEQEQRVFLSLMESCGICFVHRKEDSRLGVEAEYIAPDLLPDRSAVAGQIASQWEHPGETVSMVCEYPYDDPSLIRSLIAEFGRRAKDSAVYWRYGACGYDLESSSHFLLDYQHEGTRSSRITLECKGSRCNWLAEELRKLIEPIHTRHGMRDAIWSGDSLQRGSQAGVKQLDLRATTGALDQETPTEPKLRLKLGPAPSRSAKEHFVSYAWGDDTPDGLRRTQAIEELCNKAKQSGIEIIRDNTHIQTGDRISKFMDRLGGSQRVFVILSQKYLESEFCMYELWSIWRNCKQNPDQFLSRIRVYQLPCAKISKTVEQVKCGVHWIRQKAEIDALVRENGLSIIGETALNKYKCMQDFAAQTSEILAHITDVLRPKSFDDLLATGFGE